MERGYLEHKEGSCARLREVHTYLSGGVVGINVVRAPKVATLNLAIENASKRDKLTQIMIL